MLRFASIARPVLAVLAIAVTLALPAGSRGAAAPASTPRTFVVLSTTDVKGKTGPCGCHIPKGGLARIAAYTDSVRATTKNLLTVTNGGFFPEMDDWQDNASFMMDAFKVLGTDAIGVGDRELRFGRAFLVANARRSGAPLVCANLYERGSHQLLLAPYVLKKVNGVTTGVFGLMSDKVELGPSRDSLATEDPATAATRTVAEMKQKGATVIVLLSSLGKVESEDLVTGVPGIDLVVCGRNVPIMQKGRTVGHTVACYGGEQGQYMGRTLLTLDAGNHVTAGENETFQLGPEVGDQPQVLTLVKSFEDAFNDKLRKREREKALSDERARLTGGGTDQAADRFLGSEFCQRCHKAEYEQWKSTPHARAWQALVDAKQETKPECVGCHVTGHQQMGGFKEAADAPRVSDVQCETCHGMGTQHESWPAQARRITASTCQHCHTAKDSPKFDFAAWLPYVDHEHKAAELPVLVPTKPPGMK